MKVLRGVGLLLFRDKTLEPLVLHLKLCDFGFEFGMLVLSFLHGLFQRLLSLLLLDSEASTCSCVAATLVLLSGLTGRFLGTHGRRCAVLSLSLQQISRCIWRRVRRDGGILLQRKSVCRRGWLDWSVVSTAHVRRARVGAIEIEIVTFAVVAQGGNTVIDEIGIRVHSQVILRYAGCGRHKLCILEANLIEAVDVVVQVRTVSASVSRHDDDTAAAGTAYSVSMSVVDDEYATGDQVDDCATSGVMAKMRDEWWLCEKPGDDAIGTPRPLFAHPQPTPFL